jgi:hypothetical protein
MVCLRVGESGLLDLGRQDTGAATRRHMVSGGGAGTWEDYVVARAVPPRILSDGGKKGTLACCYDDRGVQRW